MNHYEFLDKYFDIFYTKFTGFTGGSGLLVSDGDKCSQYRQEWEDSGIPFSHGVAIYLLLKDEPYTNQVRETKDGWVCPAEWVIENYKQFKDELISYGEI